MGVKKISKERRGWREETSTEKIRAMFSSPDVLKSLKLNPNVLKDLESSLRFLELLKEMRLYGSPAWKAADKSYRIYLNEKIKKGVDVRKITDRYHKMFRIRVDNTSRAKEDFNGEFREIRHSYGGYTGRCLSEQE